MCKERGFSSDLTFSVREENLLKISRRVKEYKVEVLNPPREGKKLLVLDVDYTLFGESAKVHSAVLLPVTGPPPATSCLHEVFESVLIVTKINHSHSSRKYS